MRPVNNAVARLLVAIACAVALAGCSSQTSYVKGTLLRTESYVVGATPQYAVNYEQALAPAPPLHPTLVLKPERRFKMSEQARGIFQKVLETRDTRPAFQPAFFLWPVNVIRTPLGLVGCGVSGISAGLHYAATGVGLVVAGFGSLATRIALAATIGMGSGTGGGVALANGLYVISVALMETPLAALDLPQTLIYRTPIYPATRDLAVWPSEWRRAIKGSWDFALGYRTYPPFFFWPETQVQRGDVPGEELAGDWAPQESFTPWEPVERQLMTIEGQDWRQDVVAEGGQVRLDLRRLSQEHGAQGLLLFTAKMDTSEGLISRQFRYTTPELLR